MLTFDYLLQMLYFKSIKRDFMSSIEERCAKDLRAAIENDDKQEAECLFISAIKINEALFIAAIRKTGALRCSNYSFKAKIIEHILSLVIGKAPKCVVSKTTETYFLSVSALMFIADTLRPEYRKLVSSLNVHDFKSYIASTDELFWFPELTLIRKSATLRYDGFALEEIAAAFSRYFYQLTQKVDCGAIPLHRVNEDKILNKHYINKLAVLCQIGKFREAEILIDSFGYSAIKTKKSVIITAPSPLFEKSIRLGYIHAQNQMLADNHNLKVKQKGVSLQEFCDHLICEFGKHLFSLKEEPSRRIVMALPDVSDLRGLLAGDSVFMEEAIQLAILQKEFLITPSQILLQPVFDSLTILDIIKFQRLFCLLQWSFKKYIETNSLKATGLFYTSMIPVWETEQFIKLIGGLYGEKKAEELKALFSWDARSNSLFDVQAQPILLFDNRIVVPLGIAAASNLVRNIMMLKHFRFDSDSNTDPVGDDLSDVLTAAGFSLKQNVKYEYTDCEGEADIIAIINDSLFIIECKNSLHPCSPFELRTSYDYIRKASDQLSQIVKLLADINFCDYLAAKTDLNISGVKKIYTCIVTGNRMFSGWRENGHAVRPLYEFCNIINNGKFKMRTPGHKDEPTRVCEFAIWQTDRFAVDDLVAYIENESVHKPRLDAMEPWRNEVQVRDKMLVFESFLMDPEKEFINYSTQFRCRMYEEKPTRNEEPSQGSSETSCRQPGAT